MFWLVASLVWSTVSCYVLSIIIDPCCARDKQLVYHVCEDACERVRQIGRATDVHPAG